MSTPEFTPYCCEIFPKIMGHFYWLQIASTPTHSTMPHVPSEDKGMIYKWNINHCPSCGKLIRGCWIPSVEIEKSRENLR